MRSAPCGTSLTRPRSFYQLLKTPIMNWMDFNKTGDFWKAWQDSVSNMTGQTRKPADPVAE